jgi:hypothetical protein
LETGFQLKKKLGDYSQIFFHLFKDEGKGRQSAGLERLESDSFNLIQVLRDLKVTHPSLERLESDSSSLERLERFESDSSKKSTSSKPLTCEASVKVLFRRQVYSNSSTGLEKSAQGVWNTPPSPTFGALLSPAKGLVWKRSFYLGKNPSLKTGSITV